MVSIECTKCFNGVPVEFDKTRCTEGDWRITVNPLAWGNPEAEIVVLGFSKGPTQAGALANTPHNAIAYKGSRHNVGKILAHIGLIDKAPSEILRAKVDQLISDECGRFHFGSLIRCTVERYDRKAGEWKGSGGGMRKRTEFFNTIDPLQTYSRGVLHNIATAQIGDYRT